MAHGCEFVLLRRGANSAYGAHNQAVDRVDEASNFTSGPNPQPSLADYGSLVCKTMHVAVLLNWVIQLKLEDALSSRVHFLRHVTVTLRVSQT